MPEIPSNILAKHQVRNQIELYCLSSDGIQQQQLGQLRIHSEAFSLSQNFTQGVQICACDISHLEFHFLRGFHQLKYLVFRTIAKVYLADWTTFPLLSKLEHLRIVESTGLNEWNQFPILANGLTLVDLERNAIHQDAMNRILQWLHDSPTINTLVELNIKRNLLTRIPKAIPSFTSLAYIFLGSNPINGTICAGSFISTSLITIKKLFLDCAPFESIEPGAIQGE